jgi:hypothetical protein
LIAVGGDDCGACFVQNSMRKEALRRELKLLECRPSYRRVLKATSLPNPH